MHSREDSVISYLNATTNVANLKLKFKTLESTSGEDSIVIPWAVKSVSLNAGVSEEYVKETVSKLGGLEIYEEDYFGVKYEIIRGFLEEDGKEELQKVPGTMTIRNVMNLIVYQYVLNAQLEINSLVKVSDALFYIKNSVMIPDDFMPEHLMGNVEGNMSMTLESIRRQFQFLPGKDVLFVYPEKYGQKFSRIGFLYADQKVRLSGLSENEVLLKILKRSFNNLQSDPRYKDFESSRVIKNLIYQLEVRKTRELKRPLFNQDKIDQITDLGIPVEGNRIPERVKISMLNELRSHFLTRSGSLSKEWLGSQIGIS